MTVAQARRALADAFRQAELDSPELDARLLVGHALGLDHTALTVDSATAALARTARARWLLAARRLDREPVARILGVKEFWGLPLRLNEATLVPRPETETVVEAALAAIDPDGLRTRALRIADLGTGSGALLIALLHRVAERFRCRHRHQPRCARGCARQCRPPRLCLARAFRRLRFRRGLAGGFDLCVSNPPYIASGDIAALPPGGAARSPARARRRRRRSRLLSRHCGTGAELLKPGGHLVVELGKGQETAVAALFAAAGLRPSPAAPDLSGIPRALRALLPQ